MSTTAAYDDLLAEILGETSREAVQAAADEPPADHVLAIPVRQLAAEAPALPPLKLPRLTEKTMNGARITELIDAGRSKALVLTVDGLSIKTFADVQHSNEVIVLAEWREVSRRVVVQGVKPSTIAKTILQQEQQAHRLADAAAS